MTGKTPFPSGLPRFSSHQLRPRRVRRFRRRRDARRGWHHRRRRHHGQRGHQRRRRHHRPGGHHRPGRHHRWRGYDGRSGIDQHHGVPPAPVGRNTVRPGPPAPPVTRAAAGAAAAPVTWAAAGAAAAPWPARPARRDAVARPVGRNDGHGRHDRLGRRGDAHGENSGANCNATAAALLGAQNKKLPNPFAMHDGTIDQHQGAMGVPKERDQGGPREVRDRPQAGRAADGRGHAVRQRPEREGDDGVRARSR